VGRGTTHSRDLCLHNLLRFRSGSAGNSWRIPASGDVILLNMSDTDLELLARYIRHHAEDAFAEIVRRHLDLVHSAALRQVRSPQLAEEVAQSTFLNLARHAHRLAPDTILTAWLYQVTRLEGDTTCMCLLSRSVLPTGIIR